MSRGLGGSDSMFVLGVEGSEKKCPPPEDNFWNSPNTKHPHREAEQLPTSAEGWMLHASGTSSTWLGRFSMAWTSCGRRGWLAKNAAGNLYFTATREIKHGLEWHTHWQGSFQTAQCSNKLHLAGNLSHLLTSRQFKVLFDSTRWDPVVNHCTQSQLVLRVCHVVAVDNLQQSLDVKKHKNELNLVP